MSLVWHIVRKDLRRLVFPLTLWLVLLVGETGWTGKIAGAAARADRLAFEGMGSLIMVWEILVLVVGFLLAAGLVMEDSLVGTQAFWRTRPVSGLRLLAAKIAGALLMFSVLPALLMLPVWLWCGFSAGELGAAALALAAGQLPLSLAAFALASVTETSGQFVVRLLVTGFLLPLWLMFSLDGFSSRLPAVVASLTDSRRLLVLGVIFLTLGAVILHQYLTRRLRRSGVLVVAGLVLMPVLGRFWPWDFSPGRTDAAGAVARETDPPVQFTHTGDTAVRDYTFKPGRARIVVGGDITGVPAGSYVRVEKLFGTWNAPGARRNTGRFLPTDGAGVPPATVVSQVAGLLPVAGVTAHWDALGYESTDWLMQLGKTTVIRLDASVQATLMRGTALGRLPLHQGTMLASGASRTRLAVVERRDGFMIVRLEERDAVPSGPTLIPLTDDRTLDPNAWMIEDSYLMSGPAFPVPVLLGRGNLSTVRVHSIQLGRRELVITPPTRVVDGRTEEIPGWEETTVLEKIRFRAERTLVRPFVADIQIPPNL